MRVIKADVELGRGCQASWSAQFQLAARELMGGEFTLSPDMVLGTKAMEVKWLERWGRRWVGFEGDPRLPETQAAPTWALATTMGKRLSKKKRQQLKELHASPKAGFECSPNGLKAQINKARDEVLELRAQLERLHQQLDDAMADFQQVQADMEQLQAAHQEVQGDNVSLEQVAEERTHAIQLLQQDKRRLSLALRNVRRCRVSGPRLTRHQRQLMNILMRHQVSPEVLQRCAEGDFTLQLPKLRTAVRLEEVAAASARAPARAARKATAAACCVGGVVVNVGDHASQQRVAAAAAAGCSRVVPAGVPPPQPPLPQQPPPQQPPQQQGRNSWGTALEGQMLAPPIASPQGPIASPDLRHMYQLALAAIATQGQAAPAQGSEPGAAAPAPGFTLRKRTTPSELGLPKTAAKRKRCSTRLRVGLLPFFECWERLTETVHRERCSYAAWFKHGDGIGINHMAPHLLNRQLSTEVRTSLTRFRLGNSGLGVEKARFEGVTFIDRTCTRCTEGVVDDAMHFIFECTATSSIREQPEFAMTLQNNIENLHDFMLSPCAPLFVHLALKCVTESPEPLEGEGGLAA
ncbi:hypothetical protein QJQ45_026804 [Haematococcus lacustris]|nr:hypothetical protein QJQ45_026804 [Haematococcus lacustris]